MKTIILCAIMAALFSLQAAEPVPVVFDTDMGNDVDDALALAILHAFESRGEARIIAVTITKDNPFAAPYVDLVNNFYGRGGIPVGVVKNGKTPEDSKMIRVPAERKRADGSFVFPRKLSDGRQAPDAVALLRQVLAREKDGSVVMIQVGFSTNFARLLDSAADSASPLSGRELVSKKVKLLSTMAGEFPTGPAEYNVREDVPAAKKVFGEWPTPVVVSGFEVGKTMKFPAVSIEHDFAYVENHPVTDAYRNFMKMPYDRDTWDLTSALYAVRPVRGYFSLSEPGRVTVDDKGVTGFKPSAGGNQRYIIMDDVQRARTLAAMVVLASEPPQSAAAR